MTKLNVPGDKIIMRRVKSFYSSRRSVVLTKKDPEKNKKRKLANKANQRTYV